MSWTPEKRAAASARTTAWLSGIGHARLSEIQRANWVNRRADSAAVTIEERSASALLAAPRNGWLDVNFLWSAQDIADLKILADAKIEKSKIADSLGRSIGAITEKAASLGLRLPRKLRLITKKPHVIKSPRIPLLSFPYVSKRTDAAGDLLAINELVPRAMPEFMRADIVQEIMVAVLSGETTIAELRIGGVRRFVSMYRRNYESIEMVSLDAPRRDGRSWHDILASG